MATPNVVPRADQEGGLGTAAKSWGKLFIENPTAGGTAAATISNLDVDQIALDVNANNTTANVVDIDTGNLTTGNVIDIRADALTTGGVMHMDINDSLTGANTNTLLKLDYDKTGVTGSGSSRVSTGLHLDLRDSATNHASGTVSMTGILVDLENTSNQGSISHTGMLIICEGGDAANSTGLSLSVEDGGTDIILQSSADTGDYFSIATTTHGATTITTVDDDAAAANLTFTIDGDINMNPAGDFSIGGTSLILGEDDNSTFSISRKPHSDGVGGRFYIIGGHATDGQTDTAGGDVRIYSGRPTGNAVFGTINFFGGQQATGSGTSLQSSRAWAKFQGTNTYTEFIIAGQGGLSSTDIFSIQVAEHGATTMSVTDASGANNGDFTLAVNDGEILIDTDQDITLDTSAGNINFADSGTDQIVFDMDGNARGPVIRPAVDGDSLILAQRDGDQVARIFDGAAAITTGGTGGSLNGRAQGLGYRRPYYSIRTVGVGAWGGTLAMEESGMMIGLDGTDDIVITLPTMAANTGVGWHCSFVITTEVASGKSIVIQTGGAGSDNDDDIILVQVNIAESLTSTEDGDKITMAAGATVGTYLELLCIMDGSAEKWLAKCYNSTGTTVTAGN